MAVMINGVTNPVQAAPLPDAQPEEHGRGRPPSAEPRSNQPDAVELSEAARKHAEQSEGETIRRELVDRVRAEIAAGTYLTDDKLDAAASRLSEVLRSKA